MSWRNELTCGILRAERIFYGTSNGGLGSELDTTELGWLDGITPGTGEASKCLVLDANADITGGIRDFKADRFIYIGEDDTEYGRLYIFGTAVDQGGFIRLYTAANSDTNDEFASINVTSEQMWLGFENDLDMVILHGPSAGNELELNVDLDLNANLIMGATTITETEIAYLDGLTAGTAAASKALVLDASSDLTSGINDFTIDGALNLAGGSITIGEQDVVAGAIFAYGHATGSAIGGKIELQLAADYDTTIDSYSVRVNEDDLQIGPNTDPDAILFDGGTNTLILSPSSGVKIEGGNSLMIGVDDSGDGTLIIYGGTSDGGSFRVHVGSAYDTTIENYGFSISGNADLWFGPNTDADAMKYDATTNAWHVSAAGGFHVTDNNLFIGTDDNNAGDITMYSGIDTASPRITMIVAPDYDTTITQYTIGPSQDDFQIGPSTNADALLYDGALNKWILSASGGTDIAAGNLSIGVDDATAGMLVMFAGSDTPGPRITMVCAPDYDDIITQYTIDNNQDDLEIGPSNDADALKYDGAEARWEITGGSALNIAAVGGLLLGGTSVSASADELNLLDGVTAGSITASLAVVVDASKDLDAATGSRINNLSIDGSLIVGTSDELTISGASITATTLNVVGNMKIGAAAFVEIRSSGGTVTFDNLSAAGTFVFQGLPGGEGGDVVSAVFDHDGAIDLNFNGATKFSTKTDGVTIDGECTVTTLEIGSDVVSATGLELNTLDGVVAAVVFSEAGGTTTGTCQCTFNDAAGVKLAIPTAGTMYFSSVSTGLDFLPVTTSVVTAKGNVDKEGAQAGADVFHFVTDAAGELDFTFTAAADDYYLVIVLPTGKLQISSLMQLSG
jgi:hypothetical protein